MKEGEMLRKDRTNQNDRSQREQHRELEEQMFIFFLAFDLLFSLVSILLTWLVSQYFVGRSVWFAINAKEGDCWKMIEYCLRGRLLKQIDNVCVSIIILSLMSNPLFVGMTTAYMIQALSIS